MTTLARARRRGGRGSSLVEFALVAFQLLLVMLAALEFCRMVLVYTTLANASRVGARYAITHGSKRGAAGYPNGSATQTIVCNNVVRDYAKSGLMDTSKITCTVVGAGGDPGGTVSVTVTYRYDPFTVLPLKYPLGSTTEGIITF